MELVKLDDGTLTIDCEFEQTILEYNRTKKMLELIESDIRSKLQAAMEKGNIKSIKTDNISVTYKDGYDRESFNSKKFKQEHQDLFDEYVSFVSVKPSVQIKVSDND